MGKPKGDLCKALEKLQPGESHEAPREKHKSIPSLCKRLWGNGNWSMKKNGETITITRKPSSSQDPISNTAPQTSCASTETASR